MANVMSMARSCFLYDYSEQLSVAADEEIVAVIAAAIAMAESESNGLKFRVVSFRRI